jgi:hypothetical protein
MSISGLGLKFLVAMMYFAKYKEVTVKDSILVTSS